MARYGKSSQKKVKQTVHKFKHGLLRMGKSGKKVKSRRQAIAIGLSEAAEKEPKSLKKRPIDAVFRIFSMARSK